MMRQFMFTERQLIILYELAHTESITASTLSLNLGVSIRTIKKEIKNLKELLKEYDITLESIPGVGYRISFDSSNQTVLNSLFNSKFLKRTNKFYKSNHERVNYIIVTLLFNQDFIKIDDLADSMYIARSTINKDLIEVRKQLLKYDISLRSKPTYGVIAEGNETSIRNAILDYVFYSNSGTEDLIDDDFFKNIDNVHHITQCLHESLEDMNIPDYSLVNIARIMYITNYRIHLNKFIDQSEDLNHHLLDRVTPMIEHLEYEWNHNEILRLAQYIDVNIMYEQTDSEDYLNMTQEIIEEIRRNFNLDLSQYHADNLLFSAHVEQMVHRLNHGTIIRNPLLYENLRKYLFASKLAISASKIIEERMNVVIPLEEFSFIVLYFQSILYRIKARSKITVSFIEEGSYFENLVYKKEIENYFINDDLIIVDDKDKNADITVSLRSNFDKDSISVDKKNYLKSLKQEVLTLRKEIIDWDQYLSEDSIVSNIECNDKDELFAYIINHFKNIGVLKAGPVSQDDFISLELGSQILHFQDYGKVLDKPIVFIGVLSKPIIFDKTSIKVVVHIKTKRDGDKDLASICHALGLWLNSEHDLVRFIEQPSLDLFYSTIVNYL